MVKKFQWYMEDATVGSILVESVFSITPNDNIIIKRALAQCLLIKASGLYVPQNAFLTIAPELTGNFPIYEAPANLVLTPPATVFDPTFVFSVGSPRWLDVDIMLFGGQKYIISAFGIPDPAIAVGETVSVIGSIEYEQ